MFEAILGSALAPAVQAGVGEAAVSTVAPTVAETALDAGLTNALAGTGLNSIGQATAGLGLDQGLIGAGMNNSLFQALGQIPQGFTNSGIGEASNFATGAGLEQMQTGGLFDNLGDIGNMLQSDQANNVFKGLGGAYNMYKQGKASDNAQNIQNQQLMMQQDAYNRDKSADQRRQKLVF